jgi:hypothetical protein
MIAGGMANQADLGMKRQTLELLAAPKLTRSRRENTDPLLQFLDGL